MATYRAATILILCVTGASAQAQWAAWLNRNFLEKIKVSGSRTIGFHQHKVDGDREAFSSLTMYGQGASKLTDTGSITLSGKQVLGVLDFDFTLADSRFGDPQQRKITLNYKRGPVTLQAGDIQGSLLNTNAFASMGRAMKGVSGEFRSGRFAFKALRTETKGAAKTVSLQGANSAGPYYLQSSQIVADSEIVEVDGKRLSLGADYVIDYQLGSITFLNRVISPTSAIVVTYETFGFNSRPGLVQGAGVSYDSGKFGAVGLTYIEQNARGGSGLSQRAERFQGFGAPSTPYFLEFEPLLSRPIIVRVDGLLQVRDVDYYFDSVNPTIFYFRRFIPTTSTVEVVYTPKPTQALDGDRQVVGFDYRLPLGGSQNYIKYSQAIGKLKSDATPLSGTARGIQAAYQTGPFRFRSGWRDVPQGFVAVETRGFNRNERAFDFGVGYEKGATTFDMGYRNASIGLRRLLPDGSIGFASTRTTNADASAKRTIGGWLWAADVSRITMRNLSLDSRLDTTSLSASRTTGRWELRAGADHQVGKANQLQNKVWTPVGLNMLTGRLDGVYRASNRLSLNGRTSLNQVRFGNRSGSGHDWSIGAGYQASKRLSLDATIAQSDSGALSVLSGFQSSFGVGYDGNGFSGGATSSGIGSGASGLKLMQAHANYRINDGMDLDLRASKTTSSGLVSSNTDTTALSLAYDWRFLKEHSLALAIQRTETRFLDSPISSHAMTLNADVSGRIARRWTYALGTSYLFNGGSTAFRQSSLSVDGSLAFGLSPRQNLSLRFSQGFTNGYLPQRESFVGMFYEHQLFRNVSLIGSYKVRKLANLDPNAFSGAYRSQGFDLELSFNFGS